MHTSTIRRGSVIVPLLMLAFVGSSFAQRTVTLRLNTATAPDTLRTTDEIQVRGCLDGCSDNLSPLPGGDAIAWDDRTTLKPTNVGGDYWETTFQVPDDTTLNFKFYAQLLEDNNLGGWEDGDNHPLEAGTGDTTFTLHYFRKGSGAPYDWRPFESKEDSVGVWFRVFMATEDAVGASVGYDRLDTSQEVAVRGDDFTQMGPLDWGTNKVVLSPESEDIGTPGYDLFSGVAYYPASMAGMTQNFKYIVNDGGWESRDNRQFEIPTKDSTLHWVYFNDSKPATELPVESALVFSVDLQPLEDIGIFSKARGDTIWVFGGFNGWQDCPSQNPDLCQLFPVAGTNLYEGEFTISQIPMTNVDYKFFVDFADTEFEAEFGTEPPPGWEEGHLTGIDRRVSFEGAAQQVTPLAFYNDVEDRNIIPDGSVVDVTFSVDMSTALPDSLTQPFDPAGGDSVWIELQDPLWAVTQGFTFERTGATSWNALESVNGGDRPDVLMTDDDSDGVYTGTISVTGPTYGIMTYKYLYGRNGTGYISEEGEDNKTAGRNRARFIQPNPDGSWPDVFDLPVEEFHTVANEALPYETNNVAVEQIGSDLPETVTLMSNYPNPFSESTSFEYTVTEKTDVKISVYNVIGQHVATVVDAVQPAGTYRANFEAKDLASGTYFYRLETNGRVMSRPMILVR